MNLKNLKELPRIVVVKLTCLINVAFRLKHAPTVCKIAEVVIIQKQGKDSNELSLYRPVSLLLIVCLSTFPATSIQSPITTTSNFDWEQNITYVNDCSYLYKTVTILTPKSVVLFWKINQNIYDSTNICNHCNDDNY